MVIDTIGRICTVVAAFMIISSTSLQAQSGDDLRFFSLDQPIITSLDEAPADIALVTTAIVARMRGVEGTQATEPVVFSSVLSERMVEPSFRYDGFHVVSITISFIGPADSWEAGRRLYGTILFADQLGRRTAVSFGVEYLLDGEEIYVTDISLELAVPAEPDIRLYILPTDSASEMLQSSASNHLELMAFISKHALDVTQASGICGCAIVVATFDRLPRSASLFANVSNAKSGEKILMGSHFVLDFEGWRVAILDGQVDLSAQSPMALQALYARASTDSESPPVFSVARSYIPGGDR